jgi:pyrrolidone-carboxylate peptidase
VPLPLVLVTGFGPFERRRFNPSRVIAAELERDPPRGLRVRSTELSVSFTSAPLEVASFVARHARAKPALLLGLGVQNDGYFRLETRARGNYTTARTDNDGIAGSQIARTIGPTLRTRLDLDALAELLRASGARDVRVSDDAGGYVCERTYYALLEAGAEHDIDTLFLHIPPAKFIRTATQTRIVRAWLEAIAARRERDRQSGR